jgi:hypothetical protein
MVKCHNCGEEGHYSDRCSKGKKVVKCHNCGEEGHYSDRCSKGKKVVKCHNCGEEGHYSDRCEKSFMLKLSGKWGNKSALVAMDSDFYSLKMKFIGQLQAYIDKSDMDRRNQTPHVELSSDSDYDKLDGSSYLKCPALFEVHDDYVAVKLKLGLHMTLFYKKGLFSLLGYEETMRLLQRILDFAPTDGKKCSVCYDKPLDTIIKPCNHVVTCGDCAKHMKLCPACRGPIATVERIFII